VVLRVDQDGVFETNCKLLAAARAKIRRQRAAGSLPAEPIVAARVASSERHRVSPVTLKVAGLGVRFGGVAAVRDVNLTVEPGQVHGLIGPNGAGKTTFIDAVTGFVTPHAGSIVLGDADIMSWSAHRRARAGLARSFQSGDLFTDLTVLENLAVPCDAGSWTRYVCDLIVPRRTVLSAAALAAVDEFQLGPLFHLKPEQLSFGQRRRAAIARAIAGEPSVLLLDEPASGLDDVESQELADLIRALATDWGIAVLLVEHNLDLVLSVCDVVTVMESGAELLAAAPPHEVRNHPDVLEAYIGVRTDDGEVTAGKSVTPSLFEAVVH